MVPGQVLPTFVLLMEMVLDKLELVVEVGLMLVKVVVVISMVFSTFQMINSFLL